MEFVSLINSHFQNKSYKNKESRRRDRSSMVSHKFSIASAASQLSVFLRNSGIANQFQGET